MTRSSNRFWLIVWPVVVLAIQIALLAGSLWLFPSHNEPGVSFALPLWLFLLWPWFLGMWAMGKVGAAIGIVIAFLWLPAIAFFVARHKLKHRNVGTPNITSEPISNRADAV